MDEYYWLLIDSLSKYELLIHMKTENMKKSLNQ